MGFDDIQLELGVATQCGKCESCARAVWSECCRSHPLAHLQLEASSTPSSATIPLQLLTA